MIIYGDIRSGNCYKIKLLTSILGIEHEWIHTDILAGDASSQEFLAKNPIGKIPLLEMPDGNFLSESNAILNFLASGSELVPEDPFHNAKVLQWQFFEQYFHEPYIAVARFIAMYLGLPEERRSEYESKQEGGHRALKVMESQLNKTPFLIGEHFTIADISLYAYTHVADEGGFDLADYMAINRWLDRIKSQPAYVGMS